MGKYKILIKDNTGKIYITLLPVRGNSKHVALYEAKMLFLNHNISDEYHATIEDQEKNIIHTITSDNGILTVIPR